MEPRFEAIVLNRSDNVATLLVDAPAGRLVRVRRGQDTLEVQLKMDVKFGHKVAITDIAAGDKVIKYGRPIGVATQRITIGEHVHVHNVQGVRAH